MENCAGSRWDTPETVAGFAGSPPNAELVRFALTERQRTGATRVMLDLGCGAGRNAVPLAQQGWRVLGVDRSLPMLQAAVRRATSDRVDGRFHAAMALMDRLPVRDRSCDLLVAHGIWNLARTGAELRAAVREAARVARPGAGLFVFTFSRTTLPEDARPVEGESFVFTQFSGEPQCFLTGEQLISELAAAGFAPDAALPLRELNRPRPGALPTGGAPPVIFEGTFRRID